MKTIRAEETKVKINWKYYKPRSNAETGMRNKVRQDEMSSPALFFFPINKQEEWKMEIEVIKRDGRTVRFHKEKIQNVIEKGFANVGTHCSEENVRKVLNRALNQIEAANLPQIEIEKIQDQVEEAFVEEGFIEEYKAFKNYRQKRAVARDCFSSRQHRLMKTLENFGIKDSKEVNEKRENANINGDSAMGMMLQYGSTLTKAYTTSYCLDPKVAAAHENGDIHIHDMDFYPMGTTTCRRFRWTSCFRVVSIPATGSCASQRTSLIRGAGGDCNPVQSE